MNKTVIVTGGAKRIGKAICKTFHDKGFDIICHYNSSNEEAEALGKELNNLREDSCKLIKFDLNETNNYKNFTDKLISLSNSIDVLINNASAFYATSLGESKEADWEALHNSNLRGPYLISELLKENLIKSSGNIINITDAMVIRGMKNYTIYSTAKGGLETLTKSLAKELAPKVRVNGVAPGAILLPSDGSSNEELLLSQIPLGRLGTEQDIASAAFHLCQNTYITGQILRVDGGRSLS